jgi:hypothetical protein
MTENETPDAAPADRQVNLMKPGPADDLLPVYEKSWAVVIGISDYLYISDLPNAVNDAFGMAEVLVTRLNFPPENVFLATAPRPDPHKIPFLLPENIRDPTKAEIEDLLLTIIPGKAGINDRVLVFYAGHGEPRPMTGENKGSGAFLVPVDARQGRWNTYIDWELIRHTGNDFCKAKHIFYILDACYSGIVNTRDTGTVPRDVRDALTSRARQALAAGHARQVVVDAGHDGHSPFTYHLIKGLKGGVVDSNLCDDRSGISALLLINYVTSMVSREDNTEQTPSGGSIAGHGGGDFIFTSPFIGFSAGEHFRLGRGLLHLGLATDNPVCYESAVRNLEDALRLKQKMREDESEGLEWLGRALILTGSTDAAGVLEQAIQKGSITAPLYLGIAYAKQGIMDKACGMLSAFAAGQPGHADAAWSGAYADQIRRTGGGRKLALLVGIGTYADLPRKRTSCVNDVSLMKALLVEVYGFDPDNIWTLTNEQATALNILALLDNVAGDARPQDTVVFFFSGQGTRIPAQEPSAGGDGQSYVLIPHDARIVYNAWKNVITEPELDALLTRIPARDKLFIAGAAHVCPERDPSAGAGGYRFFAACSRDQSDREKNFNGTCYGAFPYHLDRILREPAAQQGSLEAGAISDRVAGALRTDHADQDPRYFGRADVPLLPPEPRGVQTDFLDIHAFGDRRNYDEFDVMEDLMLWQNRLDALGDIPHPRAWISLARGWLAQWQCQLSAACAKKALGQPGHEEQEARRVLCEALLQQGEWEAAAGEARALEKVLPAGPSRARSADICKSLREDLARLSSPHRRALIVAIQDYSGSCGISLQGPAADAQALVAALTTWCGFAPEDIELLADTKATREAILARFGDLVSHAGDEPAFFWFAGLGTDPGSGPAIVAADAADDGKPSVIPLAELSRQTTQSDNNLVAVFDAGFTRFDHAACASMASRRVFIPEGERETSPQHRTGEGTVDRDPARIPLIGLATIYPGSVTRMYQDDPVPIEDAGPRPEDGIHGVLTADFVEGIKTDSQICFDMLDYRFGNRGMYIKLKQLDTMQQLKTNIRLFQNIIGQERALSSLHALRDLLLHETKELLKQLTDLRRSRDPDSYLDRAICHVWLDEYAEAREAAELCLGYGKERSGQAYPCPYPLGKGEVFWPEAHYIHGCSLYQLKKYSAAESALAESIRQFRSLPNSPDLAVVMKRITQRAKAHYWHGSAVNELISQNLRVAVQDDFREYQRLGEPLGNAWVLGGYVQTGTGDGDSQGPGPDTDNQPGQDQGTGP